MDLRRQIAIVRKWFPLLVVTVLLAAGAAYGLSGLQEKVYEAKATLIVGQSLSAVNPDYNQLLVSQRLSATYARVATTRPILDGVIKQLGLSESSDALAGRVRADAPLDSTVMTVTAQDGDPERAAAIANALAEQLIAAASAIQGHQTDLQVSIDADLAATRDQIKASQLEVERLGALASPTPQDVAALNALQDRLMALRSTYASLLPFSAGNAANLLSVVEPAVAPTSPVSPRPLVNTLLAATIGLLVAAGIAFGAEYLDDAVRDPDAVQEVANLSTLGTIARMKGDRGRREIYRLATLLYPRSGVAEAYRTLRSNIEFAWVDTPIRTLLVTSSNPGEGKTITASNLAVVFAQSGRRVLLVDADLRKPGVHVAFDLPNTDGLTSLLRDEEVSLDAIAHTSEQENLRILTTGPLPPNPAEVLGSQRMRTILERLKASADIIIVDSPPLRAVTDSAILSAFLDGTLLVIDASRSHRGAVRQGREALAKAGANVLGAVLNRGPAQSRSAYADYYGSYHGSEDGADRAVRGVDPPPERLTP